MSDLHPDFVEVCTLNAGQNLVINDRRVAGPDFGGGSVGQRWAVRKTEIMAALGITEPAAPDNTDLVMAEDLISRIEALFPNWKSNRDLPEAIEMTLHHLRNPI